jgi:hypothetical protein
MFRPDASDTVVMLEALLKVAISTLAAVPVLVPVPGLVDPEARLQFVDVAQLPSTGLSDHVPEPACEAFATRAKARMAVRSWGRFMRVVFLGWVGLSRSWEVPRSKLKEQGHGHVLAMSGNHGTTVALTR